jgi:uncharacterized protein (DUF1330 family)
MVDVGENRATVLATEKGNRMTKAYWINAFKAVTDGERLSAYIELAGQAMRAAGGRFPARGMPEHAFEQGVLERTTLIEFDTVADAVAAYERPAYQEALRVLGDAAERDLRIFEAVPPDTRGR